MRLFSQTLVSLLLCLCFEPSPQYACSPKIKTHKLNRYSSTWNPYIKKSSRNACIECILN